jgi:hypothetical protein
LASLAAVPERYDINPGNIGRIHGDKNEPNPAKAETNTLVSTVIVCRHQLPSNHYYYYYSSSSNKQAFYVCINTYFQIISKLFPYFIYNKTKEDNTASFRVNLKSNADPRSIITILLASLLYLISSFPTTM